MPGFGAGQLELSFEIGEGDIDVAHGHSRIDMAKQLHQDGEGGLYGWEKARTYSEVILVEGLFDYAALRQAGFHNVTCSLGTHPNDTQFRQLCEGERKVYVTFDVDQNQSGQQAAEQLARRLDRHGVSACRVVLPEGHDPNSFFVQGEDAHRFQSLLKAAQP